MKNMFTKTLYQKRYQILWWLIGMALITMVTMSVFNSFSSSASDAFKNVPAGLKKILNPDSFKEIGSFIGQQIFSLRMPLISIILSISILVSVSSGDEQKGLLETQLSLPISRTRLLLQKLAAALLIIALASFGSLVGIELTLPLIHQHYGVVPILENVLNCFVLAVDYGLVAFTLAAVTGRRGLAIGLGSAFAFASYLLNSLAPSVTYLQSFDKLTLFHYYATSGLQVKNFSLLVSLGIVLIIVSVIGFNRRDIKTS
jgi:ABC-2 type transport system permease protein